VTSNNSLVCLGVAGQRHQIKFEHKAIILVMPKHNKMKHIKQPDVMRPMRPSDMRSNFIEVALDGQGKSRIVRIESPRGDIFHTLDLKTNQVHSITNIGTPKLALVTRYNVAELKCNGTVKTLRPMAQDPVPQISI
jgi:hypothetical protein